MVKPGSAIRCHSCNAIVPWVEDKPVVECAYCHSQVVIRDLEKPIVIGGASSGSPRNLVALAVGAAFVAGIGGFLLFVRSAPPPPPPAVTTPPVAVVAPPKPTPPPPPKPKAWKQVLEFGELGTGPGMFTNPRFVAVTDDGEYFVAERDTGRVHKFDATGKFVQLTELTADKLTKSKAVFGMAADHAGHVWVVRNGDLLQLSAADGKIVKTIAGDYPDTYFHGSVSVDAKNGVYATTDRMGDHDLVIFSAEGKKTNRFKKIHSESVAVDGTGTMFVARGDQIDVLGPDGAVKSRFAARGRTIKVDDRGHFYVDDDGITVFDPGGARLLSLDVPSFTDFTLARDGSIVALLSSGKVAKFELTLPAK